MKFRDWLNRILLKLTSSKLWVVSGVFACGVWLAFDKRLTYEYVALGSLVISAFTWGNIKSKEYKAGSMSEKK